MSWKRLFLNGAINVIFCYNLLFICIYYFFLYRIIDSRIDSTLVVFCRIIDFGFYFTAFCGGYLFVGILYFFDFRMRFIQDIPRVQNPACLHVRIRAFAQASPIRVCPVLYFSYYNMCPCVTPAACLLPSLSTKASKNLSIRCEKFENKHFYFDIFFPN